MKPEREASVRARATVLQDLRNGIDDPQTDPDPDPVDVLGQRRRPEHSRHGHRGDRETNREEVSRGLLLDDVADQEES
jgi:hypothetical protein